MSKTKKFPPPPIGGREWWLWERKSEIKRVEKRERKGGKRDNNFGPIANWGENYFVWGGDE